MSASHLEILADIAVLVAVGLVMGSFLATLVLRLPEDRPLLFGRSCCDACGAVLGLRQLVPIASWLAQKGRCSSCAAKISVFYPLMELAGAGVALWAAISVDISVLPLTLALGWALLALAVMDIRSLRLSDVLIVPLMIVGLAAAWQLWPASFADHVIGALVGVCGLLLIRLTYAKLRAVEGLGLGDVKLACATGAWLGWQGLPSVLLLGCITALLVILVRRYLGHRIAWNDKVPFGSYLCLGTWLVWLYGPIGWG